MGVLFYVFYIWLVNTTGDVRIYSTFHAHPIAKAVSLSPYFYPWFLSIVFSAAAIAIPLIKESRLFPNEMLFPEKAVAVEKNKKKLSGKKLIRKMISKSLSTDAGAAVVIFITSWTFVFGAAFMLAKSDYDSMFTRQK